MGPPFGAAFNGNLPHLEAVEALNAPERKGNFGNLPKVFWHTFQYLEEANATRLVP